VAVVRIRSKVEESVWNELRALATETRRSISELLTEAVRDYVRRRRLRPEVLAHLGNSLAANERLGPLFAE